MKSLRKIYDNLSEDSLFMVAFTGRDRHMDTLNNCDRNDFNKGRCFLKFKCLEMERLEMETKELYELVNKNKK